LLPPLDVWRWQPRYFEPICDDTGWSAEIIYSDKTVSSHGSVRAILPCCFCPSRRRIPVR
jgi:hypothetical protein